MKNAELASKVFFRPILSAKYPPKKGAINAPAASREPILANVSTDWTDPIGFSGPSEERRGNIDDDQPIHNAATRFERFTGGRWE